MEARLVKSVEPARAQVSGTVHLLVVVDERGEITSVKVIGGGGPLLQPAADTDAAGRALPVATLGDVRCDLSRPEDV